MPDLSKHLAAAKQSLDRGQYDIAIARMEDCVDIDPTQLDIYRILIDAARRKAKITEKSLFGKMGINISMSLSNDPHKKFVAAIKRLSKSPDNKLILEAADAARVLAATVKPMIEVAILLYEEHRASGMFAEKCLWNLAHLYYDKYRVISKGADAASLEKALKVLADLEKAMPAHGEASKKLKDWQAEFTIQSRNRIKSDKVTGGEKSGDYRSEVADSAKARKLEMLNRIVRTPEEAREVLAFLDQDLAVNPNDKNGWSKKGDIHLRFDQLVEAHAALTKAQEIDPADFNITMRLGDVAIAEAKRQVGVARRSGGDVAGLERRLVEAEMAEVRRRVERQPTDMGHRFRLGTLLMQAGQIEAAAAEFQRSINDPRLRKSSHRSLGDCFVRKNLLDLAADQFNSFLRLAEDDTADEAKEVRYQLARVYESLENAKEAIEHFTRLVTIDLGFKDAAERLARIKDNRK